MTSQEFSSQKKKVFAAVLLFACLSLGFVLRVSNLDFVLANFFGHLNFYDPDSYYQLRKIFYSIHQGLAPLYFDPLANWPDGMFVDWPEGFTALMSILIFPFRQLESRNIELLISSLNVGLGLLAILFAFVISRQLKLSYSLSVLAAFFVAISVNAIRFSALGSVDHHVLEYLSVGLVLFLLGLWFKRPQSKSVAFSLGVLSFYFLTVSSSFLFVIFQIFLFLFVFEKLIPRKSRIVFYFSFLLPLLPYVIFHSQRLEANFGLTYASFFHFSLVLAQVALLELKAKRLRNPFIMGGVFGLLLLLLIWAFPALFVSFKNAFFYVLNSGGAISQVTEAQALFSRFGHFDWAFPFANLGLSIFVLPVFYLFFWIRRKSLSAFPIFFLLSSTSLLIPALMQKRFLQFFSFVFLLLICLFLQKLSDFFDERRLRVFPAVVALFMAMQLAPGLRFGFVPKPTAAQRVEFSVAKLFLEELKVSKQDRQDRLVLKESALKNLQGIWANPNQGHLLQYMTGLPVLMNVFYRQESFERDFNLRTAKSKEEFEELRKEYQLGYLFFQNDFYYFDFLHQQVGADRSYYLSAIEQARARTQLSAKAIDHWEPFFWYRNLNEQTEWPGCEILTAFATPEVYFFDFSLIYRCDRLGSEIDRP